MLEKTLNENQPLEQAGFRHGSSIVNKDRATLEAAPRRGAEEGREVKVLIGCCGGRKVLIGCCGGKEKERKRF